MWCGHINETFLSENCINEMSFNSGDWSKLSPLYRIFHAEYLVNISQARFILLTMDGNYIVFKILQIYSTVNITKH